MIVPRNTQYMLIALVLAVLSWYMVSGRERVEIWVEVPVQSTGAPEDLVVLEGLQPRIDVRLRGPRGILSGLDTKTLAYNLDLSGLKEGENAIVLRREGFQTRGSIEVVEFKPSRIVVTADRLVSRWVDVEPVWSADLADDWELRSVTSRPRLARVIGAQQVVGSIEEVATKEVVIEEERPGSVTVEAELEHAGNVDLEPEVVSLEFEFGPVLEQVRINVPVEPMVVEDYEFIFSPESVLLYVEAPVGRPEGAEYIEGFEVEPDLDVPLSSGRYSVNYTVVPPKHTSVIEQWPDKLTLVLTTRPESAVEPETPPAQP